MPLADCADSGFGQFGVAAEYSHFFDRSVWTNHCFQLQLSDEIGIRNHRMSKVPLRQVGDEAPFGE